MKRLFTKVQAQASKPFSGLPKAFAGLAPSLNITPGSFAAPAPIPAPKADLKPKYNVPPIPHPCPYDHLALLVTKDGLLIRQHISGDDHTTEHPTSYVRIGWASPIKIEEVTERNEDEIIDWSDSVVVYGIVGVLELFSCSYLLVITSKAEVGNLIDGSHTVCSVKGVTPIPIVEEKARITLNTLASKNSQLARPSLIATTTLDPVSHPTDPDLESPDADDSDTSPRTGPRVQFSPDDQIRYMSPTVATFDQELHQPSARSSSSDLSNPSLSDHPTASNPVAKALAARLSFWSRLSKRTSVTLPTTEDETNVRDQTLVSQSAALLGEQESDSLEQIIDEGKVEPAVVLNSILAATAPPPVSSEEKNSELETKIVRETVKEFSRGAMYFAYTFDITRSLQHKQDQMAKAQKQHELLADLDVLPPTDSESFTSEVEGLEVSPMSEPNPTLPLWRRVDRRFWWNEWLSKPFIDAGLHSYVLPIMQGYYQVAHFVVPPDPVTHDQDVLVDYIMISRRSRYRAGLRYQRRGIDDDANVANFVETETIMRVERLGVENIFAYVQLRGSIPLFWTQTGYGLKPPPLLATDRTHTQNLDMLKRHFDKTVALYGPHAILNLAEQHGKEGAVTDGYRQYMQELDSPDARYENISKLVEAMDKEFDAQGYLWISNNTIMSQQKCVWRVNCIDCLDRTNVVQSAFARYVLNKQLGAVALLNPQSETRTEIDMVFNEGEFFGGDSIAC
ncbi:hypothetical protein H0H93_013841 [Arthromyces matolae]|nr:hypothetical protein H0H93_013841 [Arthromyces matolae]